MSRKLTILSVLLCGTMALGATFFVSTDKEDNGRISKAVKVKAWVISSGVDVEAAKSELPKSVIKQFEDAVALANAAQNAGANPNNAVLANCVNAVITDETVPACYWTDTPNLDVCTDFGDLGTWGSAFCSALSRTLVGTAIHPSEPRSRLICSGTPQLRVRIECE